MPKIKFHNKVDTQEQGKELLNAVRRYLTSDYLFAIIPFARYKELLEGRVIKFQAYTAEELIKSVDVDNPLNIIHYATDILEKTPVLVVMRKSATTKGYPDEFGYECTNPDTLFAKVYELEF